MTTGDSSQQRGLMRVREGIVTSDKMAKTVIVKVTRLVRDPMYGKFVRRVSKCVAHDEKGECKVGDLVRVVETRPLSKTKRWRVQEVVRKAS